MGLFDIFSGKSPEGHEQKGDEFFGNGAYGDARIHFEKALNKIKTRYPEKSHLSDRIAQKHQKASEALAQNHVENARALAEAGDTREAAEFYELAMGLTENAATREKIQQGLSGLVRGNKEMRRHEKPQGSDSAAEPDLSGGHGQFDTDEAEMFAVLCHALPEEIAEEYRSYGEAFVRGYTALNQGDFSTAVTELSEAMAQNPEKPLIVLELATACLHAEQHDRARQLLETCIEQNPADIRAYPLLCELFWENGQYAEAWKLLAAAPEEIQESRDMQMLMGETFFQAGDLEKAMGMFQACADAHGEDEIVSRALAKTLEASGHVTEARDTYARIMNQCVSCQQRIDPFIKRRFAELSFQSGETSTKLLDLFFSLVQEDPDNRGGYYQRIGRLYEKQGESDQAARYLELAGQMRQQA